MSDPQPAPRGRAAKLAGRTARAAADALDRTNRWIGAWSAALYPFGRKPGEAGRAPDPQGQGRRGEAERLRRALATERARLEQERARLAGLEALARQTAPLAEALAQVAELRDQLAGLEEQGAEPGAAEAAPLGDHARRLDGVERSLSRLREQLEAARPGDADAEEPPRPRSRGGLLGALGRALARDPAPGAAAPARPLDLSAVSQADVDAASFASATEQLQLGWALRDLASEDESARLAAVDALSDIDHPLTARALCARVAVEPSARVRAECFNALLALEAAATDAVEYVLERGLADASAPVRLAAVRATYRLRGDQGAATLAAALTDPEPDVRRRAVTCLGWLGRRDYAADVARLARDEAAGVRQAAIEAIGNLEAHLRVDGVIEALCGLLCDDPDSSVRRAAFDALSAVRALDEDLPADDAGRRLLAARWLEWWSAHGTSEA